MMMEITALPLDIILTIIHLIDPLDIVHLGQTCRIFHDILSEKTVWTNAVRRIRRQNAVFPAFMSKDDCTTANLRREATAPARFVSLLKSVAGYTLSPQRNRFVPPDSRDEVFKSIRLVPGGHLLVTASDIALRIWNVDAHLPHLIHSWSLHVSDILAITRTRDEDLRIAVASVDIKLQLRIFDFNFPSCNSKVYALPLEGWSIQHYIPVYTLSLDYFIFIIGPVLHAWNFTLNKYVKWSVPDDKYERMDSETTPQLVLFMSKTKLYGWEPKLPSQSGTDAGRHGQLIPDFVLDLPPVRYGQDTIRCSLATWFGSADYSLIFDIATKHVTESSYTFSSYEIQPPDTRGNPGRVQHLSTERLPSFPTPNFRMQLYVYRSAHNRLFKMWYDEYKTPPTCFTVAFRDNPRTPNDRFQEDPCVEVDLLLPTKLGFSEDVDETTGMMMDANLDPSSGRLCYLMLSGRCVGVVDYLPVI